MSNPPKVGLADALKQRELDDMEDRESTSDNEWDDAPDSPAKKPAVPQRKLVRPGEKAAADSVTAPGASAASKPQPAGSAEKRRQSDLAGADSFAAKGKHACDAYEIDLAATEYGMCKCGFKKTDHVQSAAFRAAPRPLASVYHPESSKPPERAPIDITGGRRNSSLASVPVITPNDEPEEDDGKRPCDAFDVDLLAKEFGTCKCGFKKHQHSKAAQLTQPKKPVGAAFSSVQHAEKLAQEERRREEEEAKRRADDEERSRREFEERERLIRESTGEAAEEISHASAAASKEPEEPESEGPKACDAYEIDLNAKEFGTCKCGFKKTDHSKAALFSKPLPKPIHAAAPISVPNVAPVNRAPPSFATAAKPSAPPPKPKEPEPEPEPEAVAADDDWEDAGAVEEAGEAEPEPEPAPEPEAEPEPEPEQQEGGEETAQSVILDPPHLYRALYDFEGQEAEDLSFSAGDTIQVLEILDAEWMRGRVGDRDGIFPSNFVSKIEDASEAEEPEAVAVEEAPVQEEAPAVEEEATAEEEPPVEEAPVEEEPAPVEEPAIEEPEPVEEVAEPAVEEAAVEETHAAEEPPLEEIAAAEENIVPFFATALYDFAGETEEDLNFQAGDKIEVIAFVDNEWWRGTINGTTGIFPANFVSREGEEAAVGDDGAVAEDAAGSASLGFVEALYDMDEPAEGDLGFKTGDQIEILEVIDSDWYRGALDGAEGLVPRNYVSELAN